MKAIKLGDIMCLTPDTVEVIGHVRERVWLRLLFGVLHNGTLRFCCWFCAKIKTLFKSLQFQCISLHLCRISHNKLSWRTMLTWGTKTTVKLPEVPTKKITWKAAAVPGPACVCFSLPLFLFSLREYAKDGMSYWKYSGVVIINRTRILSARFFGSLIHKNCTS